MQKQTNHICKFLLLALLCGTPQFAHAIFVENMPAVLIQPNGDTIHCFVTGDEYYHRWHDAQGFTIVQNPTTGYYVYAEEIPGLAGNLIVGQTNPLAENLRPDIRISESEYSARLKQWEIPEQYAIPQRKYGESNHGTMNNIVILIRFADDPEISTPYNTLYNMYNDTSANAVSLLSYFKEASYNQLRIVSHIFPAAEGNQIISYRDTLARRYFLPYNAASNPDGYTDQGEREFGLIERAVNYINANYPLPTDIDIDHDNDGYIDNITFIVKGTYTGWSDLLWPHKWNLYDRTVTINNKIISTFNFLLEGAGEQYFNVSTFCHEMFHALGAPDLYRYYTASEISPVASWDLMCHNSTPPQHMGAFMKYRYGGWIESIPEITEYGTYSLHSVADPANRNNCYRIATSNPNQWYVLEYRNNSNHYETALPGKGLLIYRVDTRYDGNASFNGRNYFDGLWLFRPGSSSNMENGAPGSAYLNKNVGRRTFHHQSNLIPFLTDNSIDTNILISHVSEAGNTITFCYLDPYGCNPPDNLRIDSTTNTTVNLSWAGNSEHYQVLWRVDGSNDTFSTLITDSLFAEITNLESSTRYEWNVRGICGIDTSILVSNSFFNTNMCDSIIDDTIGTQETSTFTLPFAVAHNFSYTQQIYTQEELPGCMDISEIALNFKKDLLNKSNCKIYMTNTDKEFFQSQFDYLNFSNLQLVFEGDLTFYNGWNRIVLDTPFYYRGNENLLIAFYDESQMQDSPQNLFAASRSDAKRSVSFYHSTYRPDPENLLAYQGHKTASSTRNDIRIIGCPADTGRIVGIDNIQRSNEEEKYSISAIGGNIEVRCSTAQPIWIFDILGRTINHSAATTKQTFKMPKSGIYIVKVGNNLAKKIALFQ